MSDLLIVAQLFLLLAFWLYTEWRRQRDAKEATEAYYKTLLEIDLLKKKIEELERAIGD